MLTVHMVGNAHIDPVWLWRWPSGIGEVLATCRTACDLLDEFPAFRFTRSDVWVHERVEELDLPLFERIRRHVDAGRWAAVGGGLDTMIAVRVFDDPSDSWSHGIDRFGGRLLGEFAPAAAVVEEGGPVRSTLRVEARFGASALLLWVRLYRQDPRLEIELRIDWHEKMRLAKLVFPCGAAIADRVDGIPGGGVVRPQDGRECPLVDWTVARRVDGGTLGVVSPDCSALDGEAETLRFTLLRSPAFAWHDPARLPPDRVHRFTDQGEHAFRFAILPGADAAAVNRLALAAHRPPLCVDWTRGMGAKGGRR